VLEGLKCSLLTVKGLNSKKVFIPMLILYLNSLYLYSKNLAMNKHIFFATLSILLISQSGCIEKQALLPGERYVEVSGGKIWYHIIGEGPALPLLMLHGGPGGTSNSMYMLAELSEDRPIIIFDQLGTGKSGLLTDTSLMEIDYFVDQLHEFTAALGLRKYYIFGHSWGCMLGLDYYLEYPKGIKGLVLNSPLVSTERWIHDTDTLIATLPDSIQQIIEVHEMNGTFDSREYQYANYVFYRNFIVRKSRIPNTYDIAPSKGNDVIYEYMWGPSEFTATGTLKNYDRIDRLDEIKIPTLFVTGEYDEARPATVKYYSTLTPHSEFEIIEDAGHGTMHDNQEQNVRVIADFFLSIEED